MSAFDSCPEPTSRVAAWAASLCGYEWDGNPALHACGCTKRRDHDGDHGCPCGTSERVMTPRPSAEDVIAAAFRAGPGEERPGDGTPGDVARLVLRALAGAGLTVVREPSQASTVVDAQPAASLVESSAPKGTPDLTASAPDLAADVVGTTGPTS